jgi:hypothetical protein
MKRVIVIGDTHCGHRVGLTTPSYQLKPKEKSSTKENKWLAIQEETWGLFDKTLRKLAPFHIVLDLGDMIDGKGKKSGGTELIKTSQEDQVDMAVEVRTHMRTVCRTRKLKFYGVYGTPYHGGYAGEDWENQVADKAGYEKIGSHEWVSVSGVVFDLKHKVGRSDAAEYTRHTAPARAAAWNGVWHQRGYQPLAEIVLRAHVHYYTISGNATRTVFTLPALQAMGTKFGARQCEGPVDWGFMHFDIEDNGTVSDWQPHILFVKSQVAHVTETD